MRGRHTAIGSALGVLLLIIPTAVAQGTQPSMLLRAHDGPGVLEPQGPPGSWEWTLEYRTTVPTPGEVTVRLEATADEALWWTRVVPKEVTFDPASDPEVGTTQTHRLDGTLLVGARAEAPAFEPDKVTLTATSEDDRLRESATAVTQATVTAGWRPGLDLDADAWVISVEDGGEEHVRVPLVNEANGAINATFEAASAPEGCAAEPLETSHVLDRGETEVAAVHLTCDPGAKDGRLSVRYGQAYAPAPRMEGPSVTEVWPVEIDRSTGAETQAALVGTSASVGGVPVAAWAAVLVAALAGGVRWARER